MLTLLTGKSKLHNHVIIFLSNQVKSQCRFFQPELYSIQGLYKKV